MTSTKDFAGHPAYLTVTNRLIACAPSPCGPPLAVSRLDGRYSADYYGHSVTLLKWLAPGG